MKEFLSSKGLQYKEIDVQKDPGSRDEMVQKTGGIMAVPVTVVGEEVIVGFDQKRLGKAVEETRSF